MAGHSSSSSSSASTPELPAVSSGSLWPVQLGLFVLLLAAFVVPVRASTAGDVLAGLVGAVLAVVAVLAGLGWWARQRG